MRISRGVVLCPSSLARRRRPGRRRCFPTPAFGSALRSPRVQMAADRARSAHFPQGAPVLASAEHSPLREMASAAFGASRDSVAEGVAGCCPARLSSPRLRCREGSLVKKAMPGTHRPAYWALFDSGVVGGLSVRGWAQRQSNHPRTRGDPLSPPWMIAHPIRRDEDKPREVRAVALRITSQEPEPGDRSVGADVEIRQW